MAQGAHLEAPRASLGSHAVRVRILFKTKSEVNVRPGRQLRGTPGEVPAHRRQRALFLAEADPQVLLLEQGRRARRLDVKNSKHRRRIAESERSHGQDFRHRGVVEFLEPD